MDTVALFLGVAVGLVFIASGVFKLIDGPAWPKQAADMGVGHAVARVVPWVEIVVGALTVSQLFKPWPLIALIVLLVAFTLLIITRLLDGSRPPCACFGSRSKRPLGRYHVLRNLGLLAMAVVGAIWA